MAERNPRIHLSFLIEFLIAGKESLISKIEVIFLPFWSKIGGRKPITIRPLATEVTRFVKRKVCLEIAASEAVEERKRSRGLGGEEKRIGRKKQRLYRCIVVL